MRPLDIAAVGLLVTTLGAYGGSATAFETDCREIVPVVVTLMRACSVGQEEAVTGQLVAEAAVEAVRQVIGVQATSRSVMSAREENGIADEKFRSRMVAQSSGYATVSTTSHLIADDGGSHQVRMSFAATVCIPREPQLVRQVVAFGSFKSPDGAEDARLKSEIAQIFSSSDGYAVSPENPSQGFSDIVLSGKIDSITITDTATGPTGTGLSDAPAFGKGVGAGRRIVISGALVATRTDDGQVVAQAINDFKVIPAWADIEVAAADFVSQRFGDAARELHDRLLRVQGGSQPIPSKVLRGQAGGPQW